MMVVVVAVVWAVGVQVLVARIWTFGVSEAGRHEGSRAEVGSGPGGRRPDAGCSACFGVGVRGEGGCATGRIKYWMWAGVERIWRGISGAWVVRDAAGEHDGRCRRRWQWAARAEGEERTSPGCAAGLQLGKRPEGASGSERARRVQSMRATGQGGQGRIAGCAALEPPRGGTRRISRVAAASAAAGSAAQRLRSRVVAGHRRQKKASRGRGERGFSADAAAVVS
jgi:hypothetical protein